MLGFVLAQAWPALGGEPAGARLERMQRSPNWKDGRFVNPEPLYNDYVGMFTGFACTGSQIRDPMTRRVVGAVNLRCLADESDPLLFALATSASRHSEDRMRVVAHEGETALLLAYSGEAEDDNRRMAAD